MTDRPTDTAETGLHPYVQGVIQKMERAVREQWATLQSTASRLANSVGSGGVIHVLGTGHSHIVAEEMFARAGGPLFVNPILDDSLMLHSGGGMSTRTERLPGYAAVVLDGHDLRPYDLMLVVSNSGRNAVPVEAALYAHERSLHTLAITSVAHSSSVDSRHPSGKKLMDVVDTVLDNFGVPGDAQLQLDSTDAMYGPSSTIVGCTLGQVLLSLTIEELDRRGTAPEVLLSANLDATVEGSSARRDAYRDRVRALR